MLANPAIKKALCRDVKGDRSWLHKIRPVFGHNYHFHIRIGCPKDSAGLQGAAGDADRRRLRHGARLVVQEEACRAERRAAREAAPDVGAAGGVQADAGGEVVLAVILRSA